MTPKIPDKTEMIHLINEIRDEIGHKKVPLHINNVTYNRDTDELWIITPDRPDKSGIIGKGGWVIGKLREKLGIGTIHVESYTDTLLNNYQMTLALEALEKHPTYKQLENLKQHLELKILTKHSFNYPHYIKTSKYTKNPNNERVIVALSGGADSSFSLILAQHLGLNPIAVTVNPGNIVLPKNFINNIDNLTQKLNVEHYYLDVDFEEIIKGSLEGRYHPCGRCSKEIHQKVKDFALEKNIKIVIFGDMTATGYQSIHDENELTIINLPALLTAGKQEINILTSEYNVIPSKKFGCPLLIETTKKHPHMKQYSIQRILRETRSGVLEPGQALNLIKNL